MNVKLLRDIQRNIVAHSHRFVMRDWLATRADSTHFIDDGGKETKFDSCGTAGCIAGWACIIQMRNSIPKLESSLGLTQELGAEYLDLDAEEQQKLFYLGDWPGKFIHRFGRAKNSEERAQVASERIEHFIKTKGRE